MVDLSNYTFTDWMNFTFAHPVDPKHLWYAGEYFLYDFDSKTILNYLSQFFSHPELAYLVYTPAQVDQGLSFIVSERGFIGVLLDGDIPLRLRRECIAEMATLFRFHMEANPSLPCSTLWWKNMIRNCRYHYQHLYLHVDIIRYFLRLLCKLLSRKTISPQLRTALEEGLLELKQTAGQGLLLAKESKKRLYTRNQLKILREVLQTELDCSDFSDNQ